MKYKLRCLLLCFLFIFSLQGCQKETKLEKPGNLITTTKNSSKENPNIEILTEPYDLPFDENGNLF